MDDYIREMQKRLQEKKIGYKKEFLREIPKVVSLPGRAVTLAYKLPMTLITLKTFVNYEPTACLP